MDDSISDISMDTCFQRDVDDDISDESDHEVTEKRRSFRNSDPNTLNMVVVSSRNLGVFSTLQPPPFGMNESDNSFHFESPGYMRCRPSLERVEKTLDQLNDSKDILSSKELFDRAVERGESSMSHRTKSREFEDLLGAGSTRNIEGDVHHLRSPDLNRLPFASFTKKEVIEKGNASDFDWDKIDEKAKLTLAAYDGHEGNLFPEIPHNEAQKFRKSGNAWLEGRYSTTADWKRDATGMTLEVPLRMSKDEKSRSLTYDKAGQNTYAPLSDKAGQTTFSEYTSTKPYTPKIKARTELTMKLIVAEKPKAENGTHDTAPPTPNERHHNLLSCGEAPKDAGGKRGFFRNNSVQALTMNVSRRFKRASSISVNSDDECSVRVDATSVSQSLSQRDNNSSVGNLSFESSKGRRLKAGHVSAKTEKRASHRLDDGSSSVPDRGRVKKERPSKGGRHKSKQKDRASSCDSYDGNDSPPEQESVEGGRTKDAIVPSLEDYHQPIRDAILCVESKPQTPGLRRMKSVERSHHSRESTDPSMLRKEARTVSRYESGHDPEPVANLPSSSRNEGKKVSKKKGSGASGNDNSKNRSKRCDADDLDIVSMSSAKSRRQGRSSSAADEQDYNSLKPSQRSDSQQVAAIVDGDKKSGTTRANPTASPVRVRENSGADSDSFVKASSKNSRDHRRRSDKSEPGSKIRRRLESLERGNDDTQVDELDPNKGSESARASRTELRTTGFASEYGAHDEDGRGRQIANAEPQTSSSLDGVCYDFDQASPSGRERRRTRSIDAPRRSSHRDDPCDSTSTDKKVQSRSLEEGHDAFQGDEAKTDDKKHRRKRRSSSVPRSPTEQERTTLGESRGRATADVARSTQVKRRSSSVDRDAEEAFIQNGSKSVNSRRRRSSSVPRDPVDAASDMDQSINQLRDASDSRRSKTALEPLDVNWTHTPQRSRSLHGASQSQEHMPTSPRRRRSIDRPVTMPSEEKVSPRRRRTMSSGDDAEVEEPPRTTVGIRSRSFRNGPFSKGSMSQTATEIPASASKPSFLSRIGARFEAETIKPTERRNLMKQLRAQNL